MTACTIKVKEKPFPAGPVVPVSTPGGDGQVGSPAGSAKQPEADMPGPSSPLPSRVLGAQASPWQTTSRPAGGIAAAWASAVATLSG